MDREQVLFRLFGKYCPEGTILYTESAPGEECVFVQSGAVRLSRQGARGGAEETRGPGEILGEEAFFGRAPRSARAVALRDSRLLLVNDRNLEAVVRHGPDVAAAITGKLIDRVGDARRDLETWVVAHRLRRAEPHLAAATQGPVGAAGLAEISGLTAADAASVLERLERAGALARQGEEYRAPDAAALERGVREVFTATEAS